ncbi:MAG: EAL domain-containing protein [Zoogloea sp.]|uniref:putative bifunctional diguanylate cyclase/phosphodiesterase n=1 Tax=Zoogloea sp. TaxID=49181 RepID=UPI0026259B51|nr:EAL domain-containing protein [Zoogloea sp.]MDD3327794.1 EAL domain-containing protein [Zoogloea sp.]
MNEVRILVVDDEPVTRMITESVLAAQGFIVEAAESAEVALQMLADGFEPQVILLDVIMPGMSGYEACRRLRANPRFEHLPIVMLTALDDQKSIDEAYFSGATDFITKPLNMPLLPHRIRYLLRSAMTFQQLLESRETLINTQKIARLGDWELDGAGNLVNCAEQYRALLGIGRLPRPAAALLARVHQEDCAGLEAARSGLLQGFPYQLDYRVTAADGSVAHLHEVGYPKPGAAGGYGYTQDITQRVVAEEQVRRLAWYDPHSGLLNRSRIGELTAREMSGPEGRPLPLGLLFIQLSGLRKASLLMGQATADAALLVFCERLRQFAEGALVTTADGSLQSLRRARLGRYDEADFLLALPGELPRAGWQQLAERLLAELAAPLEVDGEALLLAPSIGIARSPDDATEVQELIRCAMRSANLAAGEGAARIVFYDPAHDAEEASLHLLERQLRAAVDAGDQLQLYFQPKVDAASGQPVGAEVLMRWRHPERGMVSPGEFIPLAERTGLIRPMTDWLLARTVEQIAAWRAAGLRPGKISINVSAHSFYGGGLVRHIDEVLARNGVAGEQLFIEITESILMHDREAAVQVLSALRERHIGISVDDFGTGYSSLGYLQRFPVDEIKIDRSFVIDVDSKAGNQALVSAIVGLGRALGLSVVAEGVETDAQAGRLRQLGCDVLQGFLYARPMPAEQFEGYVAAAVGRRAPP